MHYDPIKDIFAAVIKKFPSTRILFYKTLDLMFLRSWFVRRELKELRMNFRDKKIKILDAGAGYGQYTYFMNKHLQPNEILAVDVKEKWINDLKDFYEAKKIGSVSFAVEDLTKINYEKQFDLILCVDVMEHIEDDCKVFENFFRALKNPGILLLNSPSTYGGSDVHDENTESFISEHARDGYSHQDLSEKLSNEGFVILQHKYTYGFWGDLSWRLGIKYPMMLLNLSKLFFLILPFYYLITFPFTLLMMYIDFKSENKIGAGINLTAQR